MNYEYMSSVHGAARVCDMNRAPVRDSWFPDSHQSPQMRCVSSQATARPLVSLTISIRTARTTAPRRSWSKGTGRVCVAEQGFQRTWMARARMGREEVAICFYMPRNEARWFGWRESCAEFAP